MSFFVYVINSCTYDKFYVGQTQNVDTRLHRHNRGFEKSTSPYIPWELKCVIEKTSRGDAMILEAKLKNLNRKKLIAFIEKYCTSGPGRQDF